jgi:LPS sulfotransferase NodH
MQSVENDLLRIMLDLLSREAVPVDKIERKILILSTPRCGSTLFCDVLNRFGGLGECREWFNPRYIEAYCQVAQESEFIFQRYFEFIATRTIRDSKTFVANVHVGNVRGLMTQKKLNLLNLGFDQICYLTRRHKLRQAISLVRAHSSDQWQAASTGNKQAAEEISHAQIASALDFILKDEQFYRQHLQKFVSQEFCYETFQDLRAPEGFRRLFEWLEVECDAELWTHMPRQSDEVTDQLEDSFTAYIRGC